MESTIEEIQEMRQRIGVAQKEMCLRADVSESTIIRNRALNRQPSPRIRRKLSGALKAIAEERGIVLIEKEPDHDA